MTGFGGIRNRRFVAIATAEFDDSAHYRELPGVADEVRLISAWLTDERLGERRFAHEYQELAANPVIKEIETRFRDPSSEEPWSWDDAAVVYITGHGAVLDRGASRHVLILKETDGEKLARTALPVGDLVQWLAETDIENLLVIIDVCFAGLVASELADWAKDQWLILPSALANQQAEQGALTKAINTYLKTAAEFNTQVPYLTVGLFVGALNELLPPGQKVEKIYKGHDRDQHVCLPNPAYDPHGELVPIDPALQVLALPKAFLGLHNRDSGQLSAADRPRWLFTGRERLMRDLISATRRPGVTIITGSAGSGKSAALSRLVTLSDRAFRNRYGEELTGVPDGVLPLPGSVDVALSARGLSNRQVVTQICHDLGILARAGSWDDPVRANREALGTYLANRETLVTVVIDALDEAEAAAELVTSVLEPLWREHKERLCLLLGVRSTGGADIVVEAPGEPAEEPLRDLMTTVLGAQQVPADDDERWSPGDLMTFVRNILVNTEASPYRNAAPAAVAAAAAVISSHAGRSYLVARVAAENAAERAMVLTPDDEAWLNDLRGGLLGVFRRDLQASLPSPHAWRRAVALLRAVAFARGTGLPRHRVWPKMATAVDVYDDAGDEYGDAEVRRLLQSRLSAYLLRDQRDDLTVYRLLHDELRDILRYRWRQLLEPITSAGTDGGADAETAPRADEAEIRAVEAGIAEQLLSLAKVRPTVTVEQAVPPYIRRYLAEHALDGGVLDECVPLPLVPYLDLARFRTAVGASPDRRQLEDDIPWLPVTRQVMHVWDWNRPARNAAAIAMWAELNDPGSLGPTREPGPIGGPWRVDWAVRPPDLGNVLGHHQEIVLAAAAAELSGGPIAVTGGQDGFLHVWDLSTGTHYRDREPIEVITGDGERKAILAVATARLPDGRTIAVSGGADGTVRVWDLRSGRALGEPLACCREEIVAVMTAVLPDQRVVICAADGAGTVRTWDLVSREPVGVPLPCGRDMALGLASALVGEQVLGLATGTDSGLQLWNLATGIPAGERLSGHPLATRPGTGTVQGGSAIASLILAGQDIGLTGDGDGLLLWDLRERVPVRRRLQGSDGPIWSLAVTCLDDRIMAVTGGTTTVQVWDLTAGEPVGALLTGHDGSVDAVAITGQVGGSVLAVSASRDTSVRIWDLPDVALGRRRPSRQIGLVEAVATARSPDGQAVAVTCTDTAVQVWDLERGGEPEQLTGHDSPVVSVAAGAQPDGMLILAGHWDGRISAWRTAGGLSATVAETGELGSAASLATMTLGDGRLAVLAGGWDGVVRLWDPLTGAPVGDPLPGHADIVVAVCAVTSAESRVLVVSGSRDGHVQVRDLSAHLNPSLPTLRPSVDADIGAEVTGLAVAVLPDGRPCVIAAGEDGMVRRLDLRHGTPIGVPWRACSGPVAAVAAGQLADGRLVVFTGGEDAMVQPWEASTGESAGEALPMPGPVLAMAFEPGRSSLIVGGTGVAAVRLRDASQQTRPMGGS